MSLQAGSARFERSSDSPRCRSARNPLEGALLRISVTAFSEVWGAHVPLFRSHQFGVVSCCSDRSIAVHAYRFDGEVRILRPCKVSSDRHKYAPKHTKVFSAGEQSLGFAACPGVTVGEGHFQVWSILLIPGTRQQVGGLSYSTQTARMSNSWH